jgi:hypothetical protein
VYLVRGTLLYEAGERAAAAAELEQAVRCARNEHERRQIEGAPLALARGSRRMTASADYKGCGLVVKLPKDRVEELVETGVGKPFAPAGKVFKEWLSVPEPFE